MEVSETGASNDSQTGPSSQKSESGLEGGESGGYSATWDLGNPKAPTVCLFVCYMFGAPEPPMPLNPGQGSGSPGTIAATCSTSVQGRWGHVLCLGNPISNPTRLYLDQGPH